jgi:hypothetical protein
MSSTFTKFQCFAQDIGRKVHNLHADTLKIVLTNTAPTASANTVLTDVTQISGTNGYTTGGTAVANNAYSQSGGTATLVGDAVVFTASGGSIGPFRYAVLYNDTSTSDSLIGYWDYGTAVTVTDGNTFTVKENSALTGGTILTLA